MTWKNIKLDKSISEMELPPNTEMVCLKCRANQSFFSSFPQEQLPIDRVLL